jgi:hypothetical protein
MISCGERTAHEQANADFAIRNDVAAAATNVRVHLQGIDFSGCYSKLAAVAFLSPAAEDFKSISVRNEAEHIGSASLLTSMIGWAKPSHEPQHGFVTPVRCAPRPARITCELSGGASLDGWGPPLRGARASSPTVVLRSIRETFEF